MSRGGLNLVGQAFVRIAESCRRAALPATDTLENIAVG